MAKSVEKKFLTKKMKKIEKKNLLLTPEDIANDLSEAIKSGSERLLVLYLNLYIVYFTNYLYKLISEKVRRELINPKKTIKNIICSYLGCEKRGPSVKTKMEVIEKYGFLGRDFNKNFLKIMKLVYKMRTKLVHNLRFSKSDLEREIDGLEMPIENDPTGLIKKYFNKGDPWSKIQIYAGCAIFTLYKSLEEELGLVVKYKLRLEITPDGKHMSINFQKGF